MNKLLFYKCEGKVSVIDFDMMKKDKLFLEKCCVTKNNLRLKRKPPRTKTTTNLWSREKGQRKNQVFKENISHNIIHQVLSVTMKIRPFI